MTRISGKENPAPEKVTVHAADGRRLFWSGVLLALLSFVSYFGFTLNLPGSAGYTWIHERLVEVGAVIAVLSWWRLPPRFSTRIGTGMAVAVAALLLGYVHLYSSMLPSTEGVIQVGQRAPVFSLAGPDGESVGLETFLGKPLILIFYRGYW